MLQEMICRPAPAAEVIAGSLPVVAFGDPRKAKVATLGINPSWREFLSDEGLTRSGVERRLPTTESLNAGDTVSIQPHRLREAVAEFGSYFDRNPYRLWFDPLDETFRAALGVSFYDGTACHLDLVEWATRPAWSQLSEETKASLLAEGRPYLLTLLRNGAVRLLLLNGREVIDCVRALNIAALQEVRTLHLDSGVSCRIYKGEGMKFRLLGWSTNLQSSWGVSRNFRLRLATALKELLHPALSSSPQQRPALPTIDHKSAERTRRVVRRSDRRQTIQQRLMTMERVLDQDGYLFKGLIVGSKIELAILLQIWSQSSDKGTIGSTDFGRTAWVKLRLGRGNTASLNSDTKREAVIEFLEHAKISGADVPWQVHPSQRKVWSKLSFKTDGQITPGWYCYLNPPRDGPAQV